MGKRRTKKDKIIAQLRRQVIQEQLGTKVNEVKLDDTEEKRVVKKKKILTSAAANISDLNSLFSYDPVLIKKDLLRTVVFAGFAFIIEFGLYILWR